MSQVLSNPFARGGAKKTAHNTNSKPQTDASRENAKKQLLNALEPRTDNQIEDLKYSSQDLSLKIEELIYNESEGSSENNEDTKDKRGKAKNPNKARAYRDKIRKIEIRLKGTRNKHIRDMLKKGELDVNEFCSLDEKTLNDDNYFKKKSDKEEDNSNTNIKTNNALKGGNKPKINKPPSLGKFPIPKFQPPSQFQKKTEEENINENKEDKKEENVNQNINENNNQIINEHKSENIIENNFGNSIENNQETSENKIENTNNDIQLGSAIEETQIASEKNPLEKPKENNEIVMNNLPDNDSDLFKENKEEKENPSVKQTQPPQRQSNNLFSNNTHPVSPSKIKPPTRPPFNKGVFKPTNINKPKLPNSPMKKGNESIPKEKEEIKPIEQKEEIPSNIGIEEPSPIETVKKEEIIQPKEENKKPSKVPQINLNQKEEEINKPLIKEEPPKEKKELSKLELLKLKLESKKKQPKTARGKKPQMETENKNNSNGFQTERNENKKEIKEEDKKNLNKNTNTNNNPLNPLNPIVEENHSEPIVSLKEEENPIIEEIPKEEEKKEELNEPQIQPIIQTESELIPEITEVKLNEEPLKENPKEENTFRSKPMINPLNE
ncbi:MAG: hypothetical protein MJ252_28185, partial [archaeon]|nr:hypothetical protein [archaeon]